MTRLFLPMLICLSAVDAHAVVLPLAATASFSVTARTVGAGINYAEYDFSSIPTNPHKIKPGDPFLKYNLRDFVKNKRDEKGAAHYVYIDKYYDGKQTVINLINP